MTDEAARRKLRGPGGGDERLSPAQSQIRAAFDRRIVACDTAHVVRASYLAGATTGEQMRLAGVPGWEMPKSHQRGPSRTIPVSSATRAAWTREVTFSFL